MDIERRDKLLLIVLGVAGATLYWTVVRSMVQDWWRDPNFSHGFLVPLFSAYLIYERRRDLRMFPEGSSVRNGIILVGAGLGILIIGKAGGEYFTMRSSLVLVFSGFFYILFGRDGFSSCLFPLAFLFFMIPIPYIIYDTIAFPLKMASSWLGEYSLGMAGIPVFREGNLIFLPNIQLEVADACSGIRSLLSLVALATVVSYYLRIGITGGTILILSAIPISVGTNSFRIFTTGVLSNRFGEKIAEGFFHEFSGWIVFLSGAVFVFASGILLRRILNNGKQKCK